MSETERLKLPKIDGNMTADVVRDLNSLADDIDSKVASQDDLDNIEVPVTSVNNKTGDVNLNAADVGAITEQQVDAKIGDIPTPTKASIGLGNVDNVQQASKVEHDTLAQTVGKNTTDITTVDNKVSTHLADLTSQEVGKGADIIGLPDPESLFTSTNVGGAMQELFTSVSDGKSLVGGAITGVDESVVIPTDPSFNDLASAISEISTGKKWASGTSIVNSGRLIISGLEFVPSVILWAATSVIGSNKYIGLFNGLDNFDQYGSLRLSSSSRGIANKSDVIFGDGYIDINVALDSSNTWDLEWWAYE